MSRYVLGMRGIVSRVLPVHGILELPLNEPPRGRGSASRHILVGEELVFREKPRITPLYLRHAARELVAPGALPLDRRAERTIQLVPELVTLLLVHLSYELENDTNARGMHGDSMIRARSAVYA